MPTIKKIIRNCICEVAKKERKCSRDKSHRISSGEKCLVFKENMTKKNYCLLCTKLLLTHAEKDIEKLYKDLDISR